MPARRRHERHSPCRRTSCPAAHGHTRAHAVAGNSRALRQTDAPFTETPPISTRRSPKSICSCSPGCVSEANCRACRSNQLTPQRCNRAFHRTQTDYYTLLARQLLAHHIRHCRHGDETARPASPISRRASSNATATHRAANRHVPANAAPCSARSRAQRLSASTPTPTTSAAASLRHHHPRRLHHVPPLIVQERGNCRVRCHPKPPSGVRGGQVFMSSGGQFPVSPDNGSPGAAAGSPWMTADGRW